MDAIRKILLQYFRLYSDRTVAEKVAIAAVSLLMIGGFGVLISRNFTPAYDALSWGKVFTTEELARAEQTLRDANLNEFRRDGQRIMVPRAHVERYNAALVAGGGLPANSASELEKQLEKTNVFTSRDQIQALKDVALEKELSRVIRAVPEVEDATVRWARSQAGGWPRSRTKVTATVSVRPKPGREISNRLVQSLRAAVANMVPDLAVSDVTVFDQSAGVSFAGESPDDPFDGRVVQRVREFSREYETRIRQALDYIPDVLVTVHVDLDNIRRIGEQMLKVNPKETVALKQDESTRTETFRDAPSRGEGGVVPNQPRSLATTAAHEKSRTTSDTTSSAVTAPSWTLTERELLAAMPKAVTVSVAVPRDYYRSVALKRGVPEGATDQEKKDFDKAVDAIAKEEEAKVRSTAKTLIPTGSPEEAVHVTSVVRVDRANPIPSTPLMTTIVSFLSEWGGMIAVAVFALWALRQLNRSMPPLPDLPPSPVASIATRGPGGRGSADAEEEEGEPPVPKEVTVRDKLQSFVKDDPDAVATLISKWMQQAG